MEKTHASSDAIDVWKVEMHGTYCICTSEADAIQTTGEEYLKSGEAVITQERMSEADFAALPEFDGF